MAFSHVFTITPSDTVPIAKPCQAILVGVTGAVSVVLSGDTVATVLTASAGIPLEVIPKYVRATGTTATGLVGLSE